jgi:hypothetical protein
MTNLGRCESKKGSAGFSLIEVVITIGILMSLTIAVASMLRSGFDVKAGLSQKSKVSHRLSVAMQRISNDIQHTFFVSTKSTYKNGIGRQMKTMFKIDKVGSKGDKLLLTTKTHIPMIAGRYESDLTFVTYQLQDAKDVPGRTHLYRGEYPYIPADLKEEPPTRILARNIKNITLEPWTGERWSKDYWDTGRGDTRNLLPKMVRITIEAWSEDREVDDTRGETIDQQTETLSTVIFLNDSWEYTELKEPDKTIKWGNM